MLGKLICPKIEGINYILVVWRIPQKDKGF